MTYHLGTNPPAVPSAPSAPPAPQESSPEGSAWYKVTPTVLAWLNATYPSDPAIREDVINRVARELVFIGLPPGGDEMYFLSAGSTGNFSRPASSTVPYSVPATAPRMTYQQVLDVFEIRGGGPKFKRKQPAKVNWGLYLGIGAGVAALVGLGYWASRRRGEGRPATIEKNPGFKTSKGSSYRVFPITRTQRTKAARAYHPGDSGLKSPSEMTVYLRPEDAREFGMAQGLGNVDFMVVQVDPVSMRARLVGRTESTQRWKAFVPWVPFSATPGIGLSPLELWDRETTGADPNASDVGYTNWHPGSDILSLQPNRPTVYAIPERKAYPITTAKDAYHATQRLKQGRVKSKDEARRIIAAIKREHHDIWSKYLKDYPVSRIIRSKRKGIAARHRD